LIKIQSNYFKQGLFNLLLSYFAILIAFIDVIIKARVLSTEEIGVISIIVTLTTIAASLVNMGSNTLIVKYFYHVNTNANIKITFLTTVTLFSLLNSLVVFILMYFFKFKIVESFDNAIFEKYYNLLFHMILFEAVNKIWLSIFRAENRSVLANIIDNISVKILTFVLIILIYYNLIHYDIYIKIFSLIYILRTVLFSISYFIKNPLVKPDLSIITNKNISIAVNYSLFMFLSGFTGIVTTSVDKLMLGSMLNVRTVGVYSIILALPVLLRTIGRSFLMTGHSRISHYWQQNREDKIQKLYKENTSLQMFLGFFIFIIVFVFGKEFLNFIGKEYSTAYIALIFLMVGELINISTGMCGGIIAFSNKYKFDLYIQLMLVFLTIVSNLIFIPKWGLNGAALATSISLSLYNIIKVIFVKKSFKLFPYDKKTIKFLITVFAFFIGLYVLQNKMNIVNIVTIIIISIISFVIYLFMNILIVKQQFFIDISLIQKLKFNFRK